MRNRILIYPITLLLIFSFSSSVFADEILPVSPIPALASMPSLPSLEAFGTPKPPSVLNDVMAYMPGIDFWKENANGKNNVPKNEKKNLPQPDVTPVDPLYVAAFAWPVLGKVTSGFGLRGNGEFKRAHQGIDIPVPKNTPIQAAAAGVVAEARTFNGYGQTVIIDHKNGTKTLYAHCSSLAVKKGESVGSGQIIAYAGDTGRATTSHLHFGVMVEGDFQDPMAYLKERPQQFVNKP